MNLFLHSQTTFVDRSMDMYEGLGNNLRTAIREMGRERELDKAPVAIVSNS